MLVFVVLRTRSNKKYPSWYTNYAAMSEHVEKNTRFKNVIEQYLGSIWLGSPNKIVYNDLYFQTQALIDPKYCSITFLNLVFFQHVRSLQRNSYTMMDTSCWTESLAQQKLALLHLFFHFSTFSTSVCTNIK